MTTEQTDHVCNYVSSKWVANCKWVFPVCNKDISLGYILYQELINKTHPNEN